jgi:hypothetical protein
MKKFFTYLGVAAFILILLGDLAVGYSIYQSYKTTKTYSQVEYASETNEKFYQKMVKMERDSTLIFNGFPTCLTGVFAYRVAPGDTILRTPKDSLILLFRGLNYSDINRYPFYIFKDNHNNLWSLFRRNEEFHLTREDEVKHEDWLEIKTDGN